MDRIRQGGVDNHHLTGNGAFESAELQATRVSTVEAHACDTQTPRHTRTHTHADTDTS